MSWLNFFSKSVSRDNSGMGIETIPSTSSSLLPRYSGFNLSNLSDSFYPAHLWFNSKAGKTESDFEFPNLNSSEKTRCVVHLPPVFKFHSPRITMLHSVFLALRPCQSVGSRLETRHMCDTISVIDKERTEGFQRLRQSIYAVKDQTNINVYKDRLPSNSTHGSSLLDTSVTSSTYTALQSCNSDSSNRSVTLTSQSASSKTNYPGLSKMSSASPVSNVGGGIMSPPRNKSKSKYGDHLEIDISVNKRSNCSTKHQSKKKSKPSQKKRRRLKKQAGLSPPVNKSLFIEISSNEHELSGSIPANKQTSGPTKSSNTSKHLLCQTVKISFLVNPCDSDENISDYDDDSSWSDSEFNTDADSIIYPELSQDESDFEHFLHVTSPLEKFAPMENRELLSVTEQLDIVDSVKRANSTWNKVYDSVQIDTQAKKSVSFDIGSKLAVVHKIVAWDFAYREARKGRWHEFAVDRCHFKKRILEVEEAIGYIFDKQHRMNILSFRDRYS